MYRVNREMAVIVCMHCVSSKLFLYTFYSCPCFEEKSEELIYPKNLYMTTVNPFMWRCSCKIEELWINTYSIPDESKTM